MSVRRRGRRWEARVTRHGEAYSGTFETEDEARAFCETVAEEAAERAAQPLSLATWTEQWIEARDARREIRHAAKVHAIRRAHIETWTAAHLPLKQLTRQHVAKHITSILDEKRLTRASAKHILGLIRTSLAAACDEGHVKTNVALDYRVPRRRDDNPRRGRTLSLQEIGRLFAVVDELAAPDGPRGKDRAGWPSYYRVALYAGLRSSELRGLKWGQVHLGAQPRLTIRGELKTANAHRDVPLFPPAAQALRAWRAQSDASLGWVWPGRMGGALNKDYDASWSTIVRRKAGLRGVWFRDFRVTCGSHLVSGSWGEAWDLQRVRDFLGHSTIRVTEKHYAHLLPGNVHDLAARMSAAWEDE